MAMTYGTNSTLVKCGDALNFCNTSIIDISEVDIIVYNFTLTKVECLRMTTIDIIKEILPSLEDISDWRWTRFSAHNLETPFGEDNDLIGTFENEEEESQLYISYSSDSHEGVITMMEISPNRIFCATICKKFKQHFIEWNKKFDCFEIFCLWFR